MEEKEGRGFAVAQMLNSLWLLCCPTCQIWAGYLFPDPSLGRRARGFRAAPSVLWPPGGGRDQGGISPWQLPGSLMLDCCCCGGSMSSLSAWRGKALFRASLLGVRTPPQMAPALHSCCSRAHPAAWGTSSRPPGGSLLCGPLARRLPCPCQASGAAFNVPPSAEDTARPVGVCSMFRLPVRDSAEGLDVAFVGVPLDTGTSNRPGAR